MITITTLKIKDHCFNSMNIITFVMLMAKQRKKIDMLCHLKEKTTHSHNNIINRIGFKNKQYYENGMREYV